MWVRNLNVGNVVAYCIVQYKVDTGVASITIRRSTKLYGVHYDTNVK